MAQSREFSRSSSCSSLEDLVRHACRHCGLILFCFSEYTPLIFTYREVLAYAADGCDLFASRLMAHDFEDFGTRELQSLRLQVEIIWVNSKPNSSFHTIIFQWMKDDVPVFNSDVQPDPGEWNQDLHVFTTKDSTTSRHIDTRPLVQSPGSEASMSWVGLQLQNCRENHEKCREEENLMQSMPTRVIAVGTPGDMYVHLEEPNAGKTESYVALSYCWGGGQEDIMTTETNRPEKLREIALESLPQTIKDAITVTRELRYKYLWVDAICIVQNNEKDCAQEVSAMSLVYSGASLTISAAKADNSKQGFLQQRDLVQSYGLVFELPCKVHREGGETRILLHENCVQNKILESIDRRGWTLQEHLLARRLLRYGSNQIEWKCRERISYDGGCSCRDGHQELHPDYFKGAVEERHTKAVRLENGQGEYDLCNWMVLVRDYSRRSLLKLSDKLPAFGAIAANFAQTMKWDSSDYCAGLRKSDIHMQLAWRRDTTDTSSMEKGSGTARSETSCPSWSWASLRDSIDFEPQHLRWGKGTLKVVKCEIDPKTSGYRYGEVKSSRLTVRGYVQQVCWTGHLFRHAISDHTCESITVLPISVVWDTFVKAPPGSYYCLEVGPVRSGICGIVLTKIDGQRFQRVGYFDYGTDKLDSKVLEQLVGRKMSSKFSWSHAGGTRTITIV